MSDDRWESFKRAFARADSDELWVRSFTQGIGQELRASGVEDSIAALLRKQTSSLEGLHGLTAEGVSRAAAAAAWEAVERFATVIAQQSAGGPERQAEP